MTWPVKNTPRPIKNIQVGFAYMIRITVLKVKNHIKSHDTLKAINT